MDRMFLKSITTNPHKGVKIVTPAFQNKIINLITAYHFESDYKFLIV